MLREILREFSQNHMKILSGSCLKYFVYDLFAAYPFFSSKVVPSILLHPLSSCSMHSVSVVSPLHKNCMRRKDWKVEKVKFPSVPCPVIFYRYQWLLFSYFFFFPADIEMQVQQNNVIK